MSDEAKFREVIDQANAERERSGVEIDGKKYSMVKQRIELFRKTWGAAYGIDTEVDHRYGFAKGAVVVAHARIVDRETGHPMASGHAMEFVGANDFNTYSPVEVAETSAIGRALAVFGLHGGEFASSNEIQNVQNKRENRNEDKLVPVGTVVDTIDETFGLNQGSIAERAMATVRPGNMREMQREKAPHIPDINLRSYVPKNPFADWVDLVAETSKVADEVALLNDAASLSRYWNELKEFREVLAKREPQMAAELKACFAVANRQSRSK